MFTRLTPQKVQHRSGYIVQTGSRHSLQYLDGDTTAEIEADFASVTGIYPDSMTIRLRNEPKARPASSEEKALIMERIESALKFLGEKYEFCKKGL